MVIQCPHCHVNNIVSAFNTEPRCGKCKQVIAVLAIEPRNPIQAELPDEYTITIMPTKPEVHTR